jgi:hypothetical protein
MTGNRAIAVSGASLADTTPYGKVRAVRIRAVNKAVVIVIYTVAAIPRTFT